jgi:hypothetical protein
MHGACAAAAPKQRCPPEPGGHAQWEMQLARAGDRRLEASAATGTWGNDGPDDRSLGDGRRAWADGGPDDRSLGDGRRAWGHGGGHHGGTPHAGRS